MLEADRRQNLRSAHAARLLVLFARDAGPRSHRLREASSSPFRCVRSTAGCARRPARTFSNDPLEAVELDERGAQGYVEGRGRRVERLYDAKDRAGAARLRDFRQISTFPSEIS